MSFEGKFVGVCRCGCGETFDRGDLLVYNFEGDIVIAGHEIKDEAARPVCDHCHMELPVTGVCGFCT